MTGLSYGTQKEQLHHVSAIVNCNNIFLHCYRSVTYNVRTILIKRSGHAICYCRKNISAFKPAYLTSIIFRLHFFLRMFKTLRLNKFWIYNSWHSFHQIHQNFFSTFSFIFKTDFLCSIDAEIMALCLPFINTFLLKTV